VGYTDEIGRFQAAADGLRWQGGQEAFAIIDAVWRTAGVGCSSAREIKLNTSEFVDSTTRHKVGVGSSAAITVALCAAVKGSAGIAPLAVLARRAHADLQGGAGSGVDIACSLNGGLIEYRMEGASATALQWPERLSYHVIWSGVSVSTRDQLSKLGSGISKPSRVRLVAASENMAIAWRSGDAEEIIEQYRDYCEHLYQFGIDHDLGIFDAGHDDLRRAANSVDLVYKPCGAGAGDVGIVLGTNAAEIDLFVNKLGPKHTLLDCKLSTVGVVIEEQESKQV
jgi:phosphomevalonate kinase